MITLRDGTTGPGYAPLAPGAQIWHSFPISSGVPAFFERARGSRLFDSNGKELIDLYCGSGPVILGHACPAQLERVCRMLENGATVSLRHPIELEVARRLQSLVAAADRVAFFKTGSEAVHAGIKLAIRATGRSGLLVTGYHGWVYPLQALNSRERAPNVTQLRWDSDQLLEDARTHAPQAACLLVSPLPIMPKTEVVATLIDIIRSSGGLIIADEVKAGFRRAFPTTTQQMGLHPDLVVLSKALANGFPLAVLCGREDLLGDPDLFRVFSTYASEVVGLAAGEACIDLLQGGAYHTFEQRSSELHGLLVEVASQYGARIVGVPTFFRLELPPHFDKAVVCRSLYERGVLYHPLDEILISAAHTSNDISQVTDALARVLEEQVHDAR